MEIIKKITGELANNTYILVEGTDAIIIDPPMEHEKIDNVIIDRNLNLKAVLLTHGHWDHFWGMAFFQNKYNVPIYVHENDFDMVKDPYSELHFKEMPIDVNVKMYFFEEGEFILDDFKFEIIETPGHSMGSVCIYLKDENVLISGDTLFRGTVGRWDFSGGSKFDMINSLQNKLYKLPGDTIVMPGHGFNTTIGFEIKNNDSVRG